MKTLSIVDSTTLSPLLAFSSGKTLHRDVAHVNILS